MDLEAKAFESLMPFLVTAITDCVQAVSDSCLAAGLISQKTYETVVLQSGSSNQDKTRSLLISILNSIKTDSECGQIFISILQEELPAKIVDKVISRIKSQSHLSLPYAMHSTSAVAVPDNPSTQFASGRDVSRHQTSLLGRFEDSIRQHEGARTERDLLQKRLRHKSKENDQLKVMLGSTESSYEKVTIEDRISTCEKEMSEMKERIKELESVIDEHSMRSKRGKYNMRTALGNLYKQMEEKDKRKETEKRLALAEKDVLIEKMEAIIKQKDTKIEEGEQEKAELSRKISNLNQEAQVSKLKFELKLKEKEIDLQQQLLGQTGMSAAVV